MSNDMGKIDFIGGSARETVMPHEAVQIIEHQIQKAANFAIHPKCRLDYRPLHLIREIFRLASLSHQESDFKARTAGSDVLSVRDRYSMPKDNAVFCEQFDLDADDDTRGDFSPDIHHRDPAWNLYPEVGSRDPKYRKSIELGTLQVLAEQMVAHPDLYRDVLAMVYDYFSDDDTEEVFYGAHNISSVVVLGSYEKDVLERRAHRGFEVMKEIMSRGRVPKIILCGAQTHKTEYIGDQVYASEAEHIQAIIQNDLANLRVVISSQAPDEMTIQERNIAYILDHHDIQQMFVLEDRSSDTEKNLLELSKKEIFASPQEYVLVTSQSHIHRAHCTERQLFGAISPAVGCDWYSLEVFMHTPAIVHNALIELIKMVGEIRLTEDRIRASGVELRSRWDDSTEI